MTLAASFASETKRRRQAVVGGDVAGVDVAGGDVAGGDADAVERTYRAHLLEPLVRCLCHSQDALQLQHINQVGFRMDSPSIHPQLTLNSNHNLTHIPSSSLFI